MLDDTFLERLSQLSKRQQSLFCVAILQRMSPNYLLFCESTEFAGAEGFDKYLRLFWEALLYPKTKFNAPVHQERFQELIPDPEQFDSYGVYPALDCCVVAECLFASLSEATGEEAEQASQTSMGAVLGFLSLLREEQDESKLLDEELVLEEQAFQRQLLDDLELLVDNLDNLKELRNFALNQGVSNLGISLD
ncbi:DUF416 family protein [Aliagarivorans taiwanensis]|uniref:DUF416 family protein n=1 Tax=Aliagarivorans taiwanensis TaxID=561966 RepID=UPI0003F8C1C2|nr:DUF416 family protein [Aliagarivorans taiwanensis]